MRGLWKAALLAPALVSADWTGNNLQDQDITSTTIDVPIPGLSESPDISTVLSFRIDVLTSDEICGYGNLTINGQKLAQEPLGLASIGKGAINVDGKSIEGSWAFLCLDGFYEPYAQRLDFNVISVDGKAVKDVTFWVEFKQNNDRRIFSTSASDDDSNLWESWPDSEMPDYEENVAYEDFIDFENYDIERELDELNWMMDIVQDFEYQISLKEEAMAMYLSEENLDSCDSLKCVIRTVFSKARVTAHKVIAKVYSKLSGEVESEEEDEEDEGMRPPWKHPHGKKPHWKKPHCKRPHWRRPHWKKPHWKKPHWKKPHWGKRPFPPPTHGNHSHGNHTCPGKGNHTHPPIHHRPPPFCRCPPPRHGPPHHGPPPHRPPHHGPPKDPPGKRPPPAHDGSPEGPHPDPPSDKSHGPPPGTPMDGLQDFDGPPFDGRPIFGPRLRRIKTAVKLFAVATLLFLLIAVIHRRCCCSSARRQEKQARREERRRRRAFRRAARKHAWRSWFARHICRSEAYDDLDEEEKRATLASRPIEEQEDAIASEICELSNAASVVSDMVAAEEGRMEGRVSMDSRSSLPEYMSELGGEPLPTYEDEQGTELSSVVADGFRYTPGSSEYTPGSSDAGSIGDVLGDVKQ